MNTWTEATNAPAAVLLAALALSAAPAPPALAHGSGSLDGHVADAGETQPAARSAQLVAFLDAYVEALHRRYPMSVGSTLGDDTYNHLLSDDSAQAVASWDERVRAWNLELDAMDRSDFTEADHLDADLLLYTFELHLDEAPLKRWQMPVNSLSGPQVWLPQMGQRVPLTRGKHFDDYVKRLEQVPAAIGDAIDNMRLGVAEGRVPPRVVVEPAVDQALAMTSSAIRADAAASPFYSPLNQLPADDPRRERAAAIIAEQVVPAYEELAIFLSNEYLPALRDTVGISQGIDGPRAYDLALRRFTTLPLTAQDVHQIGLDEVARIRAEMMGVIASTDWRGNDKTWASDADKFAAFVDYLRTDPRFYYDDPEDLLLGYREISKRIDAEMPRLFAKLPRLPYGVRPIPLFAAKSSPTAYYYPGSIQGGVPGYFMANTYDLASRPIYEMVALTLHEGVPGHHHQIALAQELEGVHDVRKLTGYTVYSEGWGLYAERLGLEVGGEHVPTPDDPTGFDRSLGMYANPYDNFGRLNFEMWRAMRLVVDTGIHAMAWERERAVDYMLANSALARHNVEAEVNRYIGWPGQATAYKIGELKIRELRARAEQTLGTAFDLRAFHDALLDAGPLPLPVLEAKIDRWIASFRRDG